MTQEQMKAIEELRTLGYAVVLFTPEELEEADAGRVEDRLIEVGWDVIFDLKPETEEDV